jgi:FkbM family methyltransferase
MFSILDLLGSALEPVRVVDVGAMWLGAEHEPCAALMKAGVARTVGFEPVGAECDKLNAMGRTGRTYLPYFVGDGSERTFYLTNTGATSSLYEPNTRLLKRFTHLEELTRTVETSRVRTHRLDDIPEVGGADYLKLDVQGAELDVLRGAERLLGSTLIVETEVEFVPMYVDQPLFADVDRHLRARGFAFHTFLGMAGRTFAPLVTNGNQAAMLRQHLWSNALYVRDFLAFATLEPARLLTLAALLHEAVKSFDLAALALQHYDAKTGKGLWPVYMRRLLGAPPPAPEPLD